MKPYRPVKTLLLILLLAFSFTKVMAQKEAWNWQFGNISSLSFNTGTAVPGTANIISTQNGSASVSDSLGNLLFYTDGLLVVNKNQQLMENGTGLKGDAFQNSVIVKRPGSKRYYYIFTVDNSEAIPGNPHDGAMYNLIDMEANGGSGKVIQKNIPLFKGNLASSCITSVLHYNLKDVWVITEIYNNDNYIYNSYLVTSNSVTLVKENIIQKGYPGNWGSNWDVIKVSPDGTKFFSSNSGLSGDMFLGSFDPKTGEIVRKSPLLISLPPVYLPGIQVFTAEFSPSSRFLYLSGPVNNDLNTPCNCSYCNCQVVLQYDATLTDSIAFLESKIQVGTSIAPSNEEQIGFFQAAPDGKLYGARNNTPILSVINSPDLEGTACDFQYDGLYTVNNCDHALPQFIQSYFIRFNFEGICANTPFTFTPKFFPIPDSICWNFGDPSSGINDTTTMLSPTHVFAQGGSYTVSVFVRYPDGRTEQTSRIVTVAGLPAPNLGPDITVCKGTTVTLNPGSFASYTWNNGTLGQTISVADTGQYWVEVVNDTGCINRDTLQLQWFPQPSIDEANLTIAPTTCNQSTGAITGLQVNALQPYTLTWKNGSGNVLGTTPDLYHLPVDNYTLWVSDSAGCNTLVKTYTIHNVGDTLILSVNNSAAHCARPDGSIQINATSGLTDMLQYSLNGTDWFSNGGLFSQVAPGSYQVWVKDSLGCKKVYDGNPVVISNIPGPVVQPPAVTPETGGQSNGSISITATSASDTVWYSINGGTPRPDNGLFGNLSAGSYSVTVADAFGCDTTFTATITNLPLIHLEAIAGDGSACLGNVAVVPLLANNFDGVQSFSATLYYDPTIVTCQNTLNTDPLLRDSLSVDLISALGQVNISWNGNKPISLSNGSVLTELSFASVLTGQSNVSWEPAPGICRFIDSLGSSIPASLLPGQVKVYSIPKANLNNPKPVCEGDDLLIMPTYQPGTGNGTITWAWTGPYGFTSDKQLVYFPVTTADQSGTYTLTLSDTNHCTSTITAEAIIIPTPKASFAGQDTLYLDPGSDLDAGNGFDAYAWNTGDTTQIIRTGAEGWYSVMLKDGKCSATDSAYITTPYAPLYLPTAFTPDGDRLNDVFRPVTNPDQLTTYSMFIYNRWGGLIFESHNPSIGWDGQCSGGPCPAGAYIYVLKYGSKSATLNKKERVLRGMIILSR